MTKSKSLTHVKGTGAELMKLPTQLIAFIALLGLHWPLNPRGTFCSFPQFLRVSLSATETEAAQHHCIYHSSDLYLDYKTCVRESIPEPF